MSVRDAVRAARGRFAFQADAHALWRRCALVLLATTLLLAVAVTALALRHRPADRAYAALPDGRIIPLTPLDQPIMTGAALSQWTVTAVTEALTFGHHDWQMRLAAARERFTDAGYDGFLTELEESQILGRVRDHRQVVQAVARGAPVITDTIVGSGQLGWELQLPLLLTFAAGSRQLDEELVLRVLVLRTRRDERAAGIAIEQLVAERRRS